MQSRATALAAAAILFPLAASASAQVDFFHQATLIASDPSSSDQLGTSVAISRDTTIVGAPQDDPAGVGSGSAYVFVRSGTTWTQQQKLTAADGASSDQFGSSVSIFGDTVVIGAPYDDSVGADSGSAYVFVRSGTTWTQEAKLITLDAAAGDHFGTSVSISGDWAVIGAPSDDDAGSDSGVAYVFVRNGTTWGQWQVLSASDAAAGDLFGYSVSISADTVVIGAPLDTFFGSAYVFARVGGDWLQQQELTASDAAFNDQFGASVSISGDTVLIGAPLSDGAGTFSGSAYVFVRSGTTWTQLQKLTASDAAASDQFGTSVSISGDTTVIGAPYDNEAGSAYVFFRAGESWTEVQKLTASDAAPLDFFGTSVSISGSTAVMGAFGFEASVSNIGATYVFSAVPARRIFCDASDGALASCPCSNPGFPDAGCDNAQGSGGVQIQLTDYAPFAHMARIVGFGLPGATSPTVMVIRSTVLEPTPVAFGDGILCIAPPFVRFSATIALGKLSFHNVNHGAGPGTFHYQLWYRNTPASFCNPAAAWNTSNALSITWL